MGSLQGRASIYDLQKKPILNVRFFVLSHSIILSIIFPTTIHFLFNPHKKTRALAPVSPICCIQFSMSLLLHPIKYLIRNLNPNLCLLLGRQGMPCVLQCGEACVFEALHCFLRSCEWHDVVVFAVINMHRDP